MTYRLQFRGTLDVAQLEPLLAALDAQMQHARTFDVLFDCSTMEDYTPEARARFVSWHRARRDRIARVGIVTEKTMWQVVISAMSLASGRPMLCFRSLEAAREWSGELDDVVAGASTPRSQSVRDVVSSGDRPARRVHIG